MAISPERLLMPIDVARTALGDVGRTKVYELVNEGEIVKVSIGRRSFITTESLAAYVDRLSAAALAVAADGAGEHQAVNPHKLTAICGKTTELRDFEEQADEPALLHVDKRRPT